MSSAKGGDHLMRLWEQAACEKIRSWAFECLRGSHATRLKNLPVEWIVTQGQIDQRHLRFEVLSWIGSVIR